MTTPTSGNVGAGTYTIQQAEEDIALLKGQLAMLREVMYLDDLSAAPAANANGSVLWSSGGVLQVAAPGATWQSVTLQNSWTAPPNGVSGCFCIKTIFNSVWIVADVTSPGTASVLGTLPSGFWPAGSGGINISMHRYDDSGSAHANVTNAGAISVQTIVASGKVMFINAFVPLGTV